MPKPPEKHIAQGHCPTCHAERNATIVASYEESWQDEENGVAGSEEFRVLKCDGCGSVYFQKVSSSDDDLIPQDWIPEFKTYGYVP